MGNRRIEREEEAYESDDFVDDFPRKPVKINVAAAERKLFDVTLGYDVKLRIPFQEPPKTTAEDVFVMAQVALERGKQDGKRFRLAEAAAKQSVVCLRSHFAGISPDQSKLHLRIYVADCSAGDREARIMSPGSGIGSVRVCFVWILCLPDESVVLDGGRVGMTDDHWMGIWDILHLKSGERSLINGLVPNICEGIRERIDIKSSNPKWGFNVV